MSETFLNPDIWFNGIVIRPWRFKPKDSNAALTEQSRKTFVGEKASTEGDRSGGDMDVHGNTNVNG